MQLSEHHSKVCLNYSHFTHGSIRKLSRSVFNHLKLVVRILSGSLCSVSVAPLYLGFSERDISRRLEEDEWEKVIQLGDSSGLCFHCLYFLSSTHHSKWDAQPLGLHACKCTASHGRPSHTALRVAVEWAAQEWPRSCGSCSGFVKGNQEKHSRHF